MSKRTLRIMYVIVLTIFVVQNTKVQSKSIDQKSRFSAKLNDTGRKDRTAEPI